MALPWLIGLGGIYAAKKIYDSMTDDYDDEEDEEEDLRKKERKRKKKIIKQEIKAYKEEKRNEIRRRFNAEIDFVNKQEVEIISFNTKNVQEYEMKNIELEQALKELEYFKEDHSLAKEKEIINNSENSNFKDFDLFAREFQKSKNSVEKYKEELIKKIEMELYNGKYK